jgi:hypothetical protein
LKVWFDPESPFWELRLQLGLKENQELLELAKDVLSNEIFIYGGGNFVEFKELLRRLYWETTDPGDRLGRLRE